MDLVIEKAKELQKEIQNTPEYKEYIKLKELYENDNEINELKRQIHILTTEGKIKEKDELLKIYESYPLVVNYEIAKSNLKSLLENIQNVLNG